MEPPNLAKEAALAAAIEEETIENVATDSVATAPKSAFVGEELDETEQISVQPTEQRSFDVDSAGVKDRWSRYIGAMGIDAVRRQAASSVFISGLRGLGAEIAKNIVLSGVKRLTLNDNTPTAVSYIEYLY